MEENEIEKKIRKKKRKRPATTTKMAGFVFKKKSRKNHSLEIK